MSGLIGSSATTEAAVLVDNATLRSTLRAFRMETCWGGRELFDLDIAAAAMLVESILLFDRIYLINTPTSRGTIEKDRRFMAAPFKSIPVDADTQRIIETKAAEVARHGPWKLSIDDDGPSIYSDDGYSSRTNVESDVKHIGFQRLLEAIGVYVRVFRESYARTSSEYLVHQYYTGVTEKYSLFNYFRDRHTSPEDVAEKIVRLSTKLPKQAGLTEFVSRLSWVLLRTAYYNLIAADLGLPYEPHQLRARFLQYDMLLQSQVGRGVNPKSTNYPTLMRDIADFMMKTRDEIFEENVFRFKSLNVNLPPFFVHVLMHAASFSDVLGVAIQMREESSVRAFRAHMASLQQAIDSGEIEAALRMSRELRQLGNEIKRELGVGPFAIDIENTINVGFAKMKLPAVQLALPRWLARPLILRNSHMAFIRDVMRDLARVSALGDLYEKFFKPVKPDLKPTAPRSPRKMRRRHPFSNR